MLVRRRETIDDRKRVAREGWLRQVCAVFRMISYGRDVGEEAIMARPGQGRDVVGSQDA